MMARVFRSSEAQSSPRNLRDFERSALEDQRIFAEAQEEPLTPEMIIEQARAQAEELVKEVYEEGLRRGTEAGRAQFEQSTAQCAEALHEAARAMQHARGKFLDAIEPQIVELVQSIAATVVQHEAQMDPELICATARRALSILLDRERIVLSLNPADLDALRAHKVALLEQFEGIERLDMEADEAITPGGCVAESDLMHADAQIEAQLERIFEAMTEPTAADTDNGDGVDQVE